MMNKRYFALCIVAVISNLSYTSDSHSFALPSQPLLSQEDLADLNAKFNARRQEFNNLMTEYACFDCNATAHCCDYYKHPKAFIAPLILGACSCGYLYLDAYLNGWPSLNSLPYSTKLPYTDELFLCADTSCLLALGTWWWRKTKIQSIETRMQRITQEMTHLLAKLETIVRDKQNIQKQKKE